MNIVILPVATDLGLQPSGVDRLASTLLDLGLAERLGASVREPLKAAAFDPALDELWEIPNIESVATLARAQAAAVEEVLAAGDFPLVLGGDDSILFGNMHALRRSGPAGLFMVDDCVVYGHRDRADQIATGSEDVYDTAALVRNLDELRAAGMVDAGRHAAAFLRRFGPRRSWLHLDADCLHDDVMPAVDWRLADGLMPEELIALLRPLHNSGVLAGLDVSIYNPLLDGAGHPAGKVLVDVLSQVLREPRPIGA